MPSILKLVFLTVFVASAMQAPTKYVKEVFVDLMMVREIQQTQEFVFAFLNGTIKLFDFNITAPILSYQPCVDQIKSLDVIPFTKCLLVGCTETIKLDCFDSSNSKIEEITYFPNPSEGAEMTGHLVWPLLDIHVQPDLIFSCDIKNLEFLCIKIQKDITKL